MERYTWGDQQLRKILETVSKETLIDYIVYIVPEQEKKALKDMYNRGIVDGVLDDLKGGQI